MYDALNLGSPRDKKSTILRALDMVEELKERKQQIVESFGMGVRLLNGKPDVERLEMMRQRVQELEQLHNPLKTINPASKSMKRLNTASKLMAPRRMTSGLSDNSSQSQSLNTQVYSMAKSTQKLPRIESTSVIFAPPKSARSVRSFSGTSELERKHKEAEQIPYLV